MFIATLLQPVRAQPKDGLHEIKFFLRVATEVTGRGMDSELLRYREAVGGVRRKLFRHAIGDTRKCPEDSHKESPQGVDDTIEFCEMLIC
jgi:hypothetical protein